MTPPEEPRPPTIRCEAESQITCETCRERLTLRPGKLYKMLNRQGEVLTFKAVEPQDCAWPDDTRQHLRIAARVYDQIPNLQGLSFAKRIDVDITAHEVSIEPYFEDSFSP